MHIFFSESIGAISQVILFILIPFIWWFFSARKKTGFLAWIGIKKIHHEGK